MVKISWHLKVGLIFIFCSCTVYFIKLVSIGHIDDTINYLFNAVGFLFLNVLMVTLVINELMHYREKKERLEKLNMVIEVFYSELGLGLLLIFRDADAGIETLRKILTITPAWTDNDYDTSINLVKKYDYHIDPSRIDLETLHSFLHEKRSFMLRLFENPALLEHGSFSPLLQAVFHLTEELHRRDDVSSLPASDIAHLTGDIKRVYEHLLLVWVGYMKHLQKNYPFLFSLALRTNPFDKDAHIIVLENESKRKP